MIEINLQPESKKPDKEILKILNPLIAYLIDFSYERAKVAKNEEDLLLWGRIWAGLLFLRKEVLQLGYSPADVFSKKIVMEGSIEDIENAIF